MRRPAITSLSLLFLSSILGVPAGRAGSKDILNGSVAVQAVQWVPYTVVVTEAMLHPRVVGRVKATGGTGNDIAVVVMSDTDFTNWANGHRGSAFYNSGQVTMADVRADLPGAGNYVVLLDNKFSGFTAKTVEGNLKLVWDDPPPPPPSPAAGASVAPGRSDRKKDLDAPFYIGMAGIGLLGAVIGGAVVAMVLGRRKAK